MLRGYILSRTLDPKCDFIHYSVQLIVDFVFPPEQLIDWSHSLPFDFRALGLSSNSVRVNT